MLYSDGELKKRIKAGCGVYYFYASDEALVRGAAAKVVKALEQDDPETTTLDGPAPTVEEIVLAAGTISFFGGRCSSPPNIPTRIWRSCATRWRTPRTLCSSSPR